jgi:predicted dehydrogenase
MRTDRQEKQTNDSPGTFKAAVIGLGFIGAGDPVSGDAIGQKVVNLDGTHAQALAGHPQVRLVAGSSRNEGRRKRFEERQKGVHTYADWREMLTIEKPDLVSVATNSPQHAEITIACAKAGVRAVLCEKPIATRLSDADHAIETCRKHGTLLAINHSRRWHPLWLALRDEIRGGTLGEVDHAIVHWSSGRVGNIGTHMFDALHLLLGAKVHKVSGTLDPVFAPDCRGAQFRDPGGWGTATFSTGVKAFINAPQMSKLPLVLRVVGSLGQATLAANRVLIEPCSGKLRELTAPKDGVNSLDRAVRDLIKCLTDGGTPASTGEDGLAALEVVIGFHVSDRVHGQEVSLPIHGSDRNLEVLIG